MATTTAKQTYKQNELTMHNAASPLRPSDMRWFVIVNDCIIDWHASCVQIVAFVQVPSWKHCCLWFVSNTQLCEYEQWNIFILIGWDKNCRNSSNVRLTKWSVIFRSNSHRWINQESYQSIIHAALPVLSSLTTLFICSCCSGVSLLCFRAYCFVFSYFHFFPLRS